MDLVLGFELICFELLEYELLGKILFLRLKKLFLVFWKILFGNKKLFENFFI